MRNTNVSQRCPRLDCSDHYCDDPSHWNKPPTAIDRAVDLFRSQREEYERVLVGAALARQLLIDGYPEKAQDVLRQVVEGGASTASVTEPDSAKRLEAEGTAPKGRRPNPKGEPPGLAL